MNNIELRVRVLLAVQASFLGAIGLNMRAILCRWTEKEINVRVIFDGEISSSDVETMSEVEAEIISHFPQGNVTVEGNKVIRKKAIEVMLGETAIFWRKE